MASYTYTVPNVDLAKLQSECVAAGLPVTSVSGGAINSPDVTVNTLVSLDPTQKATLDAVVAAHDGRVRRPRKMFDVYNDVGALTNAQKTAIAADLTSGTPPKFTSDRGEDSADLLVLYVLAQTGLSTGDKALVKQAMAAVYARDNPRYLVNQTFGGTVPAINIPGDEVAS